MKGSTLLWLVCILSVTLNVYFIYQYYTKPTRVHVAAAATQDVFAQHQVREFINQDTRATSVAENIVKDKPVNHMPNAQAPNRADLLAQAAHLLEQEHYGELRLFLRDYLQQQPLDMDFLLLEAQLNVITERLSDAIAHYYSLTKLPTTAAQAKVINDSISDLSGQTIAQLQRAYSWDTLAIFVEPLLQLEPQSRLYILALAEAYAQQRQFNLMENVLASLDFDDPDANKIRQLALVADTDPIPNNSDQPTRGQLPHNQTPLAVKLQQLGDHYVVNGQLGGNSVTLLIDTGASITAISMQHFRNFKRSNTQYLGRFSVNTAGGQVLAPMYQFSELMLNHAVVENISVVVLPMRNIDNVNGLLGMNFLREFDFKIDQHQSQLLLKQ